MKHKQIASHSFGSVLDIGYNQNPNIYLEDAVGIDIDTSNRPPNYIKLIEWDLNSDMLPLFEQFHTIILSDVIEHIENPSALLRECKRLLRHNGTLIVCTPQSNDYWITALNWLGIETADEGHLHSWTIQEFKRLLKRNGFTVDKVEGVQFRLPMVKYKVKCRRFPILSWQVVYVARRDKDEDN